MASYRLSRVTKKYTTETISVPLTRFEIEVLQAILWYVGGPPAGPRGAATSAFNKLDEAVGPLWANTCRDGKAMEMDGSIYLEWGRR